MSQLLYEQYKDALRRGHVAALRDRLEAAAAAYEEAVTLAPDRALPHTSLGGVLQRLGRLDAAEAAFGAALQRAPSDEGALHGRATLRVERGQRVAAADDFEALAAILERGDRLADACDAARRALELAESRTRRRTVERLATRLRDLDADPAAADALRLALQLLEPMGSGVGGASRPVEAAARGGTPGTELGEADAGPIDADAANAAAEPEPAAEPAVDPAAEPAVDPAVRLALAEAMLDSGDIEGARAALLELSREDRAAGRLDAALDACFLLMVLDPSDASVQLELAAIEMARGWTVLAGDKIRLLQRLALLEDDAPAGAAIAAFAASHGLASDDRPTIGA